MYTYFLGGIVFFAGIYLLVKGIIARTKGTRIQAELINFSTENNTYYPVFRFVCDGETRIMTGGNPVKDPAKYKYVTGDRVTIIYSPKNTRYVDVAGSYADLLYGIGGIILGGILLVANYMR